MKVSCNYFSGKSSLREKRLHNYTCARLNVQGKNERELNFGVFAPTRLRKGAAGCICSRCRFLILILELLNT